MTDEELMAAALSWLGINVDTASGPDVDAATIVAPAVRSFVESIPDLPTVTVTDPDTLEPVTRWADKVELGAVMLAARLVRRRNSPQGVAAFTEVGGAAYVSRMDPDVAQLLRLGAYAAPQVG